MFIAMVIIVVLVALVAGTLLSLRSSAGTGMPDKDVLERASRRARELEAQEKRNDASD